MGSLQRSQSRLTQAGQSSVFPTSVCILVGPASGPWRGGGLAHHLSVRWAGRVGAMVPIEGQEPSHRGPWVGSTVGQALSSSLAINLKTEDTTGPSGLLKGRGGALVSTETGVEQTLGSGGTYTLAPEACSPHALPGSSFPAPPPRPRPGAVPGNITCLLPAFSSRGSPHWDAAWDHHPPSLLGEEVGTSQGPVSSLGPL